MSTISKFFSIHSKRVLSRLYSSNGETSPLNNLIDVSKELKIIGAIGIAILFLSKFEIDSLKTSIKDFETRTNNIIKDSETRTTNFINQIKVDMKNDINDSEARKSEQMRLLEERTRKAIVLSEERIKADVKASEIRIFQKIDDAIARKNE